MKNYLFGLIAIFFGVSNSAYANNIQIDNITLTGQNTSEKFTMVQFDLSWENSWRIAEGPSNWDAAWVFVKYRAGDGPWLHAFLNDTGHNTGTGTVATIAPGLLNTSSPFHSINNPAMGVFVHRSENGVGSFSQNEMKLRWNYGANNIPNNQVLDIKVFAIEMVQVPEGAFFVGGAGSERGSFTNGSWTEGPAIPFQITSEDAITIGPADGNLWGTSSVGSATVGPEGTLPANFPKGFNPFYCMKYEITQGQYRDFLNTLSRTSQNNRTAANLAENITSVDSIFVMSNTSSVNNRNGIRCNASIEANSPINFYCDLNGNGIPNEAEDGEWIACNFLTWMDACAYMDWAGLRPMSELEFEKAGRGTLNSVDNEFAWGTTTIQGIEGVSNSGESNEISTNAAANVGFSYNTNAKGPLRVGSFATENSSREQAGASFYGIMDLSGNVWERTVSVGNTAGRNFTAAIHGNGELTSDGFSDIATWPGFVSNQVIEANGAGYRGGDWQDGTVIDRDADALNYIADVEAADGQALENDVKQAINNFIVGCKADSIWDAIKASAILAGARTLDGALVPLKGAAPTNFNFVSVDYNRKTGLKGNGSTKYLNSNRNNNADPQNSKHVAVFVSSTETRSEVNAWYVRDGAFTTGRTVLGVSGMLANRFIGAINSTSTINLTGTRDTGLVAVSRFSSTQVTQRLSGVSTEVTTTSETPTATNLGVFSRSDGADGHTDARIAFYSIGEAINLEALDARITTLMNDLDFAISPGISEIDIKALRLSDRNFATDNNIIPSAYTGFRAVRTNP